MDKAGIFGDLVEKGLTELIAPHKCQICASVLPEIEKQNCGCDMSSRRMSDDLWYAIEHYGPDRRTEEDEADVPHWAAESQIEFVQVYDESVEVNTRRQLISNPVTNDANVCPLAPSSQAPAYSSEWDIFYTDILALPRQDIFPNFYFKAIDSAGVGQCTDLYLNIDPIVSPNPDGKKWDTRTNQVSIIWLF